VDGLSIFSVTFLWIVRIFLWVVDISDGWVIGL
jgi:hypothetical protein